MKNKVVIFTENNARILVNPEKIEEFDSKPNAFVNPDLSLVKGIEPQFWKYLKGKVSLSDAIILQDKLSEVIDWTDDNPAHEQVFYREYYLKLKEEIEGARQAQVILSKLISKSEGINTEELVESLLDTLIVPTKNTSEIKQNRVYLDFVNQWKKGAIVPMDEDERIIRTKHIAKNGANNTLEPARRNHYAQYALLCVSLLAIAVLLYLIGHR